MSSKKIRLETPSTSSAFLEEVAHFSGTPPSPNNMSGGVFGGGGGLSSSASSISGGPFRGKYTRGLLGSAASSTSRFNPYSVSRDRPLGRRSIPLIRAKRDDSGLTALKSPSRVTLPAMGLAHTSSTAQRIMEKLANMSTPVLNAGRVRLDSLSSIKPLQIGSTLLNSSAVMTPTSKFAGPPKTLSPFSIPKNPVGVKDPIDWSLKNVSGIPPKMVDCGTNTDEAMVAALLEKRMNNSGSILALTSPRSSSSSALVLAKSRDMWADREILTNGGFSFSSPWSLKEIDDYVGQQVFSSKSNRLDTFGVSNVNNSGGRKEDVSKPILTNGGTVTPKNVPDVNNSFLKLPTTPPIISPKRKWECPSCMVYNNPNEAQCVCCGTFKPGPGGSAKVSSTPMSVDSTDSKPAKWTCDTCYVKNEQSSAACVCCSEPNPSKKASAIPPPASPKKWECPTCMVMNEPSASQCVCCTEKNPNPVTSSSTISTPLTTATPASTFKFGFSSTPTTSTSTTAAPSSTGFVFGTPAPATTSTTTPTPSFSFGFKPVSTPSTSASLTEPWSTSSSLISPSTSTVSSIKFGISSTTATSSPSTQSEKKAVVESWRCKICSSYKNGFDRHECEVCGSPRPKEFDPDYKSDSKPKTELKFEPIFSQKPSTPANTLSSTTSSAQNAGSPFQNISTSSAGNLFGSSSSFGSGSTFTGTGNPLAGVTGTGGFGNSNAGGSIVFGSSGSNSNLSSASQPVALPATTSVATPAFGFPSSVTAASGQTPVVTPTVTTTLASSSTPTATQSFVTPTTQPFTFGTPSSSLTSSKRKSESQNDDTSSKKCSFGSAPQESTSIPPTQNFTFGTSAGAPQLKMKEPAAAPVLSVPLNPAPSNNNAGFLEALKNANAAVKASTDKQSAPGGPASAPVFQFGSSSTAPTGPSLGSSVFGAPGATSNPPAFTFGSSNNSASAMSSAPMTMNSGHPTSGIPATTAAVAPASAPFNLTPNFNFGAPAPSTPASTFNFGATNPAAGTAGQPPALFQFSSSTPTGNAPEGRKIMKAARRFRR